MSLFDHLKLIEDTRSYINRHHDLVDIIFLVLSATVSGCKGWREIAEFGNEHIDWLKKHRAFDSGIPTRHSIARIMKAIDVERMTLVLFHWANARRQASKRPLIAIDGKTLRGAVNQQGKENTLHLVTAYDTDDGLVLYQQDTKAKGSELVTVRDMLPMLDIKDAILSFDALHCNQETLKQISQRKGDYVVQVKGNQPKLREAIEEKFKPYWAQETLEIASYSESNKGHGREERRSVFQLTANLPKELKKKWPSAKTIIAVERERKKGDRTSFDTHYYLSSLAVEPELAYRAIRQHWHIENKQHWVLDVTFKEDSCRIGDRENAKKMALIRRIVLNFLEQHPLKASKPSKMRKAAWNDDFRTELFFG
jgi:predicted transposase YbfD/YdcC